MSGHTRTIRIKKIAKIRIYKPGASGLQVIDVSGQLVNEDQAVFVRHPALTNRTRGQDVIDPYQVSQALRRNEARGWMITEECPDDDG